MYFCHSFYFIFLFYLEVVKQRILTMVRRKAGKDQIENQKNERKILSRQLAKYNKHESQLLFVYSILSLTIEQICTRGIGIVLLREHRYHWSLNMQYPVSTSQRDCCSCKFSGLPNTETFDMVGQPPLYGMTIILAS